MGDQDRLARRLDRLPIDELRDGYDRAALIALEAEAVDRIADEEGWDRSARHARGAAYLQAVIDRLREERPDLVPGADPTVAARTSWRYGAPSPGPDAGRGAAGEWLVRTGLAAWIRAVRVAMRKRRLKRLY